MKRLVYFLTVTISLGLPLQLAAQEAGNSQDLYSWLSSGLSSGAEKLKSGFSYLNPQPLLPWAQDQLQSLAGEAQEWWAAPTEKTKSWFDKSITYGQNLWDQTKSFAFELPSYLAILQNYVSATWDSSPGWVKQQIVMLLIGVAITIALAYGGGSFEIVGKLLESLGLGEIMREPLKIGAFQFAGGVGDFAYLGETYGGLPMGTNPFSIARGIVFRMGPYISTISKAGVENFISVLINLLAATPSLAHVVSVALAQAQNVMANQTDTQELPVI
jgi:hypothetical protein